MTTLQRLAVRYGIVPETAALARRNEMWYIEGNPVQPGEAAACPLLSDHGQTADEAALDALVYAVSRVKALLDAATLTRDDLRETYGTDHAGIATAEQSIIRHRARLRALLGVE